MSKKITDKRDFDDERLSSGGSQEKPGSLFSRLLEKVPFELHLPGYQFCGPQTRLAQRLSLGQTGINPLDSLCREHDISYSQTNNLEKRHIADKILQKESFKRVFAVDSTLGEKLAALLVSAAMKAKRKLGFGSEVGKIARIFNKDVKRKRKRKNKTKKSVKKMSKARRQKGKLTLSIATRMIEKIVGKKRKNRTKIGAGESESVSDLTDASRQAIGAARRIFKGNKFSKGKARIIPLPKVGGALPLIPIISAITSLGGLASAASSVVDLAQKIRGAITNLKNHGDARSTESVGHGLFVRPYKKSYGIHVDADSAIGEGLFTQPYHKKSIGLNELRTQTSKN